MKLLSKSGFGVSEAGKWGEGRKEEGSALVLVLTSSLTLTRSTVLSVSQGSYWQASEELNDTT